MEHAGTYKFTGSGALGGKEARLAAAAYLNATKVSPASPRLLILSLSSCSAPGTVPAAVRATDGPAHTR